MDLLEIVETEVRISQFTQLKLAEREIENGPWRKHLIVLNGHGYIKYFKDSILVKGLYPGYPRCAVMQNHALWQMDTNQNILI